MKTYVAEINGEAILAFRAEDTDEAQSRVSDSDDPMRAQFLSYERASGGLIWDGRAVISARLATDAEASAWEKGRDNATGRAEDGAPIDMDAGDDPDEFDVFLIPIVDPQEDDDEGTEH